MEGALSGRSDIICNYFRTFFLVSQECVYSALATAQPGGIPYDNIFTRQTISPGFCKSLGFTPLIIEPYTELNFEF